jgi:hypothetical protein
MKHAIKTGSVAMIDIASFIQIGSGNQKMTGGGGQRYTNKMEIA